MELLVYYINLHVLYCYISQVLVFVIIPRPRVACGKDTMIHVVVA